MHLNSSARPIFALAVVVVGLSFCIPLHLYPFPNYIEELLVTLGVFACSAWLMWRRPDLKFSLWSALWLLLGGLFLASALVHSASFVAFKLFYILFWFVGGLALLISEQVNWDDHEVSDVLAVVLFYSALVCAVVGLLRHFDLLWRDISVFIPMYRSERMMGLIGHSNYFAFVCLLGVLSAGWLFQRGKVGVFGVVSSSLIFIICIVLTWTRSVVLAWFVLALLLSLQFRRLNAGRFMSVVLAGLAVLVLLQPFGGLLSQLLGAGAANVVVDERLAAFGGKGGDSSGRLREWAIAWQVFREHPLLGVGIGNYGEMAFAKHIDLGVLSPAGFFIHSHNLLLQFLVELGVFGGLWLLLFFALGMRGWWRAAADLRRVLPVSILLIFSVYSFFEFPYWLMHFFVLNLLVLGALGREQVQVGLKLGKAFSVILAFVFCVTAVVYVPLVERFYWSLKQYLVRAPTDSSQYVFVDSLIRDPLMEPYGYLVYIANFEVSPKTAQQELVALERLRRHLPYDTVLGRLAILQYATGNTAESFKTIEDMRIYYGDESMENVLSQLGEAERAFPSVDFSPLSSVVGQ
ncbi:PglL family O-oligosaccharyltransferase [Pseudomonas sp. zfem003]|uniref:PglL family O-oligosaccharyltransferase n=1 Tax=Pseudomonas sp. zfem003 TaxID=3078198 RepID=UPI002928A9D4|nr:Wzy polymerase domain-containing protein [Pseudomonas sp. zfem003]MDU9397323.1 Wzy polymerase domain-containing protein [Pseudomonas sp. zfem003]